MVLPQVGAEAEIRFDNKATGETMVRTVTVTSTQLEHIGEGRFIATMTGFVERCSNKLVSYKADHTPNPCIAERVIFNPPATIAIWKDGSKTVVKCDEKDEYDPMYGLALCYMKKAIGNTSRGLNDALRIGYDELEKSNKKAGNYHFFEVRNFLKTHRVRDDFEAGDFCPVGPCSKPICTACPYDELPYDLCTDRLRKDIIRIRKQDTDGGKKE